MKLKRRTIIIIVAIVIIASVALNIFLLVRYRNNPLVINEDHPLLDPAESIYNNNDLLVNMHPLAVELAGLTQGNPDVEVYFQFLNTGSDIRINTTTFFPGSLMKLPIAMAAMKKVESGAWSMNDQLTLTEADKNPAYGTLYEDPVGTNYTISTLMNDLLVQSDDTARNIFVRNLGDQDIENVLTYLGLQDVVSTDSKVSAQRYSNFWRALYSAGYLSDDSSEQMLQLLATPHDEDLLYAGIPSSTTFAHKIGVFGNTYSDSGIVYVPNRPYILTVMVDSSSTDEVHALMKSISQDVYQYVSGNNDNGN